MARLIRLFVLALLAAFSVQATPNLSPGKFNIVSSVQGNPPLGVDAMFAAFKDVYINAPLTTCVVAEDQNAYRISVAVYQYLGVVDDKLVATIDERQNLKWVATYREQQDAYTIEPAGDPSKGITVDNDAPNAQVSLKPIITLPDEITSYSPSQLWRFVPVL
ncbi:hypothetical protein BGX28_002162 [Mortierella sp. GBA30]|nr:hypothetical protein BGX28_002162 [Mortierella sp. GBA30]